MRTTIFQLIAAALNYLKCCAVCHAVNYKSVVKTAVDVLQKIIDGFRRLGREKLDSDIAKCCFDNDLGRGLARRYKEAHRRQQPKRQVPPQEIKKQNTSPSTSLPQIIL